VTVSRREDEELMAFLDGELAPRDARDVEARIDASVDARRKVEALGELSTLVRTHYEQATSASEPNMAAAWARLEAQLGQAPVEAPVKARAESARSSGSPGWWQSVVDAFSWSHVMTGAIGVAAGAILVFALRPGAGPESARRDPQPAVAPGEGEPPPVVTASAEDTNVDDLEVQSGTGMVFQVPTKNANMPATTVIWVTDEAPVEGPI
jgi:anti-sigma factor RsiW